MRVTRIKPLPVVTEPALKILERLGVLPLLVLLGYHIGARIMVHAECALSITSVEIMS
jgi:hypothetical protein